MFALLSGPVAQVYETSAVLDCHGVGYEVLCPSRTLARLSVGQPATLFTHLHVREDALVLFGFESAAEKQLFLLLTSVSGVGPKIGLSLLSTFTPAEISAAIRANQPGTLARASGVGKRLAENLVVNLRDKLGAFATFADGAQVAPAAAPLLPDLISALTNLGYPPRTAEAAAQQALQAHPAAAASHNFAELFKAALRQVGNAA